MFNILDYLNINNTSSKEKFSSRKYGGSDDKPLSKGVMIISILLNLIISFLFILFSLDYINVIDPKLTIQNKSIYIILVYLLLISNGFMFLVNFINMIQLFT